MTFTHGPLKITGPVGVLVGEPPLGSMLKATPQASPIILDCAALSLMT